MSWNNGSLNLKKMIQVYSFYLESSDICNFDTWLIRHTFFTDYQRKRLNKFSKSAKAAASDSVSYNSCKDR